MLKAQVEVHREEYLRLEGSSNVKLQELTAALEAEREKVKGYEGLEAQLDDAVVRTGMTEGTAFELSGMVRHVRP